MKLFVQTVTENVHKKEEWAVSLTDRMQRYERCDMGAIPVRPTI